MAKALVSTSIIYRSGAKAPDRCPIEIDPSACYLRRFSSVSTTDTHGLVLKISDDICRCFFDANKKTPRYSIKYLSIKNNYKTPYKNISYKVSQNQLVCFKLLSFSAMTHIPPFKHSYVTAIWYHVTTIDFDIDATRSILNDKNFVHTIE